MTETTASAASARDEILRRVRRALADVPRGERSEVDRDYLAVHGARSEGGDIDLLAENLAEYRAHVHRSGEAEIAGTVARLLAERGSTSAVVPSGLPEDWLTRVPPDVALIHDTPDLTAQRLDAVHSVISGCALAIAETGTIVLDGGPGQGRRLLTLVPDHHICVVRVPDQIVGSVPQAFAVGALVPTRPQTWIAGPSATSDIELDRVEGVHGPRILDVVLLGAA
jgi:L-lactate dehydrogenase complex protein LldG